MVKHEAARLSRAARALPQHWQDTAPATDFEVGAPAGGSFLKKRFQNKMHRSEVTRRNRLTAKSPAQGDGKTEMVFFSSGGFACMQDHQVTQNPR